MRRLFLIFLLTLLPLQSGWAAACGYCADNCVSESAAMQQPADSAGEDLPESDCGVCQPGGSCIGSLADARPAASPLHSPAMPGRSDFIDSIEAERPERPNWARLA